MLGFIYNFENRSTQYQNGVYCIWMGPRHIF